MSWNMSSNQKLKALGMARKSRDRKRCASTGRGIQNVCFFIYPLILNCTSKKGKSKKAVNWWQVEWDIKAWKDEEPGERQSLISLMQLTPLAVACSTLLLLSLLPSVSNCFIFTIQTLPLFATLKTISLSGSIKFQEISAEVGNGRRDLKDWIPAKPGDLVTRRKERWDWALNSMTWIQPAVKVHSLLLSSIPWTAFTRHTRKSMEHIAIRNFVPLNNYTVSMPHVQYPHFT